MHQQETVTTTPTPYQRSCLIVEDSEFDSEKMKRVINRSLSGVQIKVAASLKSAREALERGLPTLILLDNNLPDGLGANFAQELANDPRLSSIPIIIVSDWPSPFMWEKAASAGVHYVLKKAEFDARYIHATLDAARTRRATIH